MRISHFFQRFFTGTGNTSLYFIDSTFYNCIQFSIYGMLIVLWSCNVLISISIVIKPFIGFHCIKYIQCTNHFSNKHERSYSHNQYKDYTTEHDPYSCIYKMPWYLKYWIPVFPTCGERYMI